MSVIERKRRINQPNNVPKKRISVGVGPYMEVEEKEDENEIVEEEIYEDCEEINISDDEEAVELQTSFDDGIECDDSLNVELAQNKIISSVLYNNIDQVIQGARPNRNVKLIKLIHSDSEEKENTTIRELESLLKTVLKTVSFIQSPYNSVIKEKIKRRLLSCSELVETIIPKKENSHFQIFGYPDLLRDIFVKKYTVKLYPSRDSKSSEKDLTEEYIILSKVNQYYSNTIIQASIDNRDIPNSEKLGSLNSFENFTSTLHAGIPHSTFIKNFKKSNPLPIVSRSQAWSILIQLCHQILFFGEFFNFNHSDIHDENVVISEEPTNFVLSITAKQAGGIPYPKCVVTFKNCYKATIIDYAVIKKLPNNDFKSSVFPFTPGFFRKSIATFRQIFNLENFNGIHSFFALASLGSSDSDKDHIINKFNESEIIVDQLNYTNRDLNNPFFISKLQQRVMDLQDFKHYSFCELNNSLLVDRQYIPSTTVLPPGCLKFSNITFTNCQPFNRSPPKYTKAVWLPAYTKKVQKAINQKAYTLIDKISNTLEFVVTEMHLLCLFIKYSTLSSSIIKFITSNNNSNIYLNGNSLFSSHQPRTPEKDALYISLKKYLAQYTIKINHNTINEIRESIKLEQPAFQFEAMDTPPQLQLPPTYTPQTIAIHSIKKQGVDIFGLVYDDMVGNLYCNVSRIHPDRIGIFCKKKILKNTIITQYYPGLFDMYPSIKYQHKPLPVQFLGCGHLVESSAENPNCRVVDENELGFLFSSDQPNVLIESKTSFLPAKFIISSKDIDENCEIILSKI